MKIRVGQEFRVPPSWRESQPGDFYDLARGSYQTGINPNRGIFYYAALKDRHGTERVPAFLLYTNNLRGLSDSNPWLDIVDADGGTPCTTGTTGRQVVLHLPPPEIKRSWAFPSSTVPLISGPSHRR